MIFTLMRMLQTNCLVDRSVNAYGRLATKCSNNVDAVRG